MFDVLASLEYSLALSPRDDTLWQKYESLLSQTYGSDLPEAMWLARQFLRCLRSDLAEPEPLNELAAFYENKGQHFNTMLCHLASLSADPTQSDIYEAAKRAYDQGILTPSPFVPTEPIGCMVSIILATKDRPARLRQAIASVLNQTFQDFEVLVINDGGTEEAKAVVDSFASPKIRYFYKEPGGHRSAMNLGLKVARGKYIAYLDDDDIYFPHHLETLVEAAEREHLDFVCSRNRWVVGRWEDGRWVETQDLTRQEAFSLERLHISAVIADLTVLHTRSLVEKVGLFWEEPPRGGEWEYWVRCSHHAPIKRLDAVTGEVRVSSIVPVNQPARALFYTELWRIYFGSAFGEAILAAAAWWNGDKGRCLEHLVRISGLWPYLNGKSRDLLWNMGLSIDSRSGRMILDRIAASQPAWAALSLLKEIQEGEGLRVLTKLPIIAYYRLGTYAVRNPGSFPRVIRRLGKQM